MFYTCRPFTFYIQIQTRTGQWAISSGSTLVLFYSEDESYITLHYIHSKSRLLSPEFSTD
jgi:hypothetical protein